MINTSNNFFGINNYLSMMKIMCGRYFFSLIFLMAFSSSVAHAQSLQQRKTDSVFVLVKSYFNNRQIDSLYALTGESFRKQLSRDAFKAVANQQLSPLGGMNASSLVSFVNNKVATYKVIFSSVTLQLLISLDQDDKIDMLLFQPFKEATAQRLVKAATSNKMLTPMDNVVDAAAIAYIGQENTAGLSIGVLKDGKIATYNYGETTKGNGKLPDANTVFEIGSITKTFTSVVLAYYVNEGKVKLSDPITRYLPDSVTANSALKDITLVDLSNHTSGLARMPDNLSPATDGLNPYKLYDKALLFGYLKTCKLNSVPGEQYAYSNLGVGLLGTILMQISGKTYDQLIADVICKPLGMKSTAQHLSAALQARFTTVYNAEGGVTPAWDFDALAPCGALHSSVNDLLIYAKANMNTGESKLGRALELTHQITFKKDAQLGLAWHIIMIDGVEYIFHNGGTFGSSSFLAFNKQKNLAVVVLSNCGETADNIGINILKKLQ
ncbi:serine hydrolase domain-containing protein [Mucilaginibacter sp. FT3.2]|uniref:serine hydrolase domain-containing protein n=1 Tax=Mucilaginibacter sp. FT3.2 TaxID=2723090 RepID=UPI0016082416|nr:serine hydrolase domain-containing protein [Mucilaginibacter sp. FT3.2]MBB6231847.1 CubicO group peptidase (beta-lactamase class C family) [Mucilaginibacter sp. FT3.2]